MKKWVAILVIFLLSVPVVFAADLIDGIEEKEPTIIIKYEGSTAITDSISTKLTEEKSFVLASATATVLKDEKYPYVVAGSEVTIQKYKCNAEICGYWLSCTRDEKEVYTNSPVWISPPPYIVVVSDIFDSKANTQTITLKEDPKGAAERVLTSYCDKQPLGKAVSYER